MFQSHLIELKHATERRLDLKRKGLEFLNQIQLDHLEDPIRVALDADFLDKFISLSAEFTKEVAEVTDLKSFCVLWSDYCTKIFQNLKNRIDDIMMTNGALIFQEIQTEYKKEGEFYTSLREVFSKHKDEELQHNFEFIECFGLGLPWISRIKLLAADLRDKLSDEEHSEEKKILQEIELNCNSLKEVMQKMAGLLSNFLY